MKKANTKKTLLAPLQMKHVPRLRLDPRILPEPYGNEQLQCGNQKGFLDVLGVVRIQQDQPMIEDGCEIGRNGYEQEFGTCCQYQ